jgi:peptide subunit release factor 1 (eRF1)
MYHYKLNFDPDLLNSFLYICDSEFSVIQSFESLSKVHVILLYQNKNRTTIDTIVHNRNNVFANIVES